MINRPTAVALLPNRFAHLETMITQGDEPGVCALLKLIKYETDETALAASTTARELLSKLVNADMPTAAEQFIDTYRHPSLLFRRDVPGIPPLGYIIEKNYIPHAKKLIDLGRQYFLGYSFLWNIRNKNDGQTILHRIVDQNHNIEDLFSSLYQGINDASLLKCIDAIDFNGRTAIDYACEKARGKNIALLINLGAKLNIKCQGESAIEKIIALDVSVLRELLSYLSPTLLQQFRKGYITKFENAGINRLSNAGWYCVTRFNPNHYKEEVPLPTKVNVVDEKLATEIALQNEKIYADNTMLFGLLEAIDAHLQTVNTLPTYNRMARYFALWVPIFLVLAGAAYITLMVLEGFEARKLVDHYDPDFNYESSSSSSDSHEVFFRDVRDDNSDSSFEDHKNSKAHQLAEHFQHVSLGYLVGGSTSGALIIGSSLIYMCLGYSKLANLEVRVSPEQFRDLLNSINNTLLENLRHLKDSPVDAEEVQSLETIHTDMAKSQTRSSAINLLERLRHKILTLRNNVILEGKSFRLYTPVQQDRPKQELPVVVVDVPQAAPGEMEMVDVTANRDDKGKGRRGYREDDTSDDIEQQRAAIADRIGKALGQR